ncbi:MAG: acyl carrier protein [Christensenellales bacterium]
MLNYLKEVIGKYVEIDVNNITMNTNLRADLGMNSLELINLVVQVEDELGVEIDETDAIDFQVVGDVVEYLNNSGKQFPPMVGEPEKENQ